MLARRLTKRGLLAVAKLSMLAGAAMSLPVSLLMFAITLVWGEVSEFYFVALLAMALASFAISAVIAALVLILASLFPSVIAHDSPWRFIVSSLAIAFGITVLVGAATANEHDTLRQTASYDAPWAAAFVVVAGLEGALIHRLFRQT